MAMIEGLKIVALSTLSAVSYGIVHDNVTARLCMEYFTVFHRRIPWTGNSPTALAFYWGIIATWWMGMGLGVPLAFFSRWGNPPKVSARDLIGPLGKVLAAMGACSGIMGAFGYGLAVSGVIKPTQPWDSQIDPTKHAAFLGDLWAHNTAYVVGFVGGIFLWEWCVRRRQQKTSVVGGV